MTGGGPGHFGGDAILRCSVPPSDTCPSYDDVVPAELTLLSTTMTVGTFHTVVIGNSVTIIGYSPNTGSLGSKEFTYRGTTYSIISLARAQAVIGTLRPDTLNLTVTPEFPSTFDPKLAVQLDDRRFLLSEARRTDDTFRWNNHGLTWAESDSVSVKITEPPPPNAYGYRTIWTALMTAGQHPTVLTRYGYSNES